jgi:N-acetylmuramoyl-L-alanine amidase
MSLKYSISYTAIFLLAFVHTTHCFFFFSRPEPKKKISIMIDPYGDALQTGRKLHDSFERGITLQIAEQIKETLEHRFSNLKVLISRSPGDAPTELQHASFANRLNVDFYLHISCYEEQDTKSGIYVYQFSYGTNFITKIFDYALIPYDQAHIANSAKSSDWAISTKNSLEHQNWWRTKGPFKIPFKPLIGIHAPAIALEIGIMSNTAPLEYGQKIAISLIPSIEKIS